MYQTSPLLSYSIVRNMNKLYTQTSVEFKHVTKEAPCIHCGKPDWCYTLSDSLTCCKRQNQFPPADGWKQSKKADDEGDYYLYLKKSKAKPIKTTYYEYPDLKGNKFVRVVRLDYEYHPKKIWQQHWNGKEWLNGLNNINKLKINIYKYKEVLEAHTRGCSIFVVEGEKIVDKLAEIGITATCVIGGSGKNNWSEHHTKLLKGMSLVLCPDRDEPGVNFMLGIAENFPDCQWVYAPPSDFYWDWSNLPQSGGSDLADWLESEDLRKEDVITKITDKSPNLFLTGKKEPAEVSNSHVFEAVESYTQQALETLYSGKEYIAIHDQLYEFNGTHYEQLSERAEQRRIRDWANSTPQETARGQWRYTLAKPARIREIWDWVLFSFAVDPEQVNPPGINCLNGVIQIEWKGRKPVVKFKEHNPDHYYTYVSQINYDPEADETDCDRLLTALETPQRVIFLRTMAASLDLQRIRQFNSSGVKALLCQGTGSNGKDAIRAAVRVLFGDGMTSASLTDFKIYDEGRKFGLAKLEHSRINWASENSGFVKLDAIQVLKECITGEPIDIERKGQQDYSFDPKGVYLFNINEAPLIDGGLQAIKRRYAVLDFNKTFCQNADSRLGQIEADPRFRYDPDFLNNQVCPALLNMVLRELANLAAEGIDYEAAEGSLVKIQEESNHLWAFCNEIGLRESPGDRIYIKDLYDRLTDWYIETGTLELVEQGERTKRIWNDQARKSDKNITAINQLYKRLQALFPKIEKKRSTEYDDRGRKGQRYISGIAVIGDAIGDAETLINQRGDVGDAKTSTLKQIMMKSETLTETQALQVLSFMEKLKSDAKTHNGVDNFASPTSPSHYTDVSASPTASPTASPNQKSDAKNDFQINHTVEVNLSVPMTQGVALDNVTTGGENHLSINKQNPISEIEYVKLKDGRILTSIDRDGLYLWGRESGFKKRHKVPVDHVAEFHYKKAEETEPVPQN